MKDVMYLKNEILNHLSNFPYLIYSIREADDNILISFNKDVTTKYVENLFDKFKIKIINNVPVKLRVYDIKEVETFTDFKKKIIVNTVESIDLPLLNLKDIDAKIDSGATTSSLHCTSIKIDRKNKTVTYIPLDKSYKQFKNKEIKSILIDTINVQSSNGMEEVRPLIKTNIVIRGKVLDTFISLSFRNGLEYPILIGKDVLSGNFLINPGM